MSADAFGAGGSDAQQTLQSFWPRVMEEIRNLTPVFSLKFSLFLYGIIIIFLSVPALICICFFEEGLSCAGAAACSNQENHEAG